MRNFTPQSSHAGSPGAVGRVNLEKHQLQQRARLLLHCPTHTKTLPDVLEARARKQRTRSNSKSSSGHLNLILLCVYKSKCSSVVLWALLYSGRRTATLRKVYVAQRQASSSPERRRGMSVAAACPLTNHSDWPDFTVMYRRSVEGRRQEKENVSGRVIVSCFCKMGRCGTVVTIGVG